jgi:uncharacterized protein
MTEKIKKISKSRTIASVFAVLWILFTAFAVTVLIRFVDLKPQIDMNFFFSSDDPQFQADEKISHLFPQPPQIVMSATGDIESEAYLKKIERLTNKLAELEDVFQINSLTSGPGDLEDAFKSPLWKRILFADGGKASNIYIFVHDVPTDQMIPKIEALMKDFNRPGFELMISGVPYVIEMIRRNLLHDFKVFTIAAFFIFGSLILLFFRSARILVGTLLACVNASILNLLAARAVDIKLGLLTANLSTIVFVLTLSHIIFITFNWKQAVQEDPNSKSDKIMRAIQMTLPGSAWSMVTTLLGFISLIFVEAKPLRQLGISGSVGTVIAMLCAYLIYPCFLKSRGTKKADTEKEESPKTTAILNKYWSKKHARISLGILIFAALAGTGLVKLNTDPSLLAYFKEGSKLRNDLEFIDRNGGSSPLKLVVSDAGKTKFNNTKAFQRLWELHVALEKDPYVGLAVSLPLIMAEAKRFKLTALLSWEWLLKIMESPRLDEVARYYITKDRTQGFFLLTMKEGEVTSSREQVIERVLQIVRDHDFEPDLVGGIYLLQSKMSQLVRESLIAGLTLLILIFIGIGLCLSFSFRVTMALLATLAVIPISMLGLLAYLHVPVDVISSPAANIAIGIGVDAMMHTLIWLRRFRKQGLKGWDAWVATREQLWKPILFAAIVICAGFGIFSLSGFPPTQRFGIGVIIGSVIAPIATLYLMPYLGGLGMRKKSEKETVV